MDKVVVRPVSLGIKVKVINERTISITLNKPQKISIEPDGKNAPLLLFANPIETDVPAKDDPNVLYFGPGIHEVAGDIIRPKAGQTVYLAGGAIVKAGIEIAADNVKIKGRGVLDGSQWPWTKGPFRNMIAVDGAKQTEIEGITILGSPKWTVCMRNSDDVTIRNLKLCGSRVQNDDGINPCNTRNVLVTDCFIRSDDDCLAMKGLNADGQNVENIVVENSALWCDRARITLLGHESRAAYMRNITYRNIDIIHMTMTAFLLEPGEEMYLENVLFENIRIHGEGQKSLARMKPVVNQYMRTKSPGFVKNVIFRNIKIHGGNPGDYWFQMVGADEKHTTTNIRFENVSINGKPMTKDSPQTQIGPHTSGIKFRSTQE
jgi:polygalacturonase